MYDCEKPERQRISRELQKSKLQLGALGRHVSDEHISFLERNVPDGMTVAEYLVEALLQDAMMEGVS